MSCLCISALQFESPEHKKAENQHNDLEDMKLRLRLMVKGDEEKSRQIESMEETLMNYKVLMQCIEQDIGQERLDILKEKSHAHLAEDGGKQYQEYRANQVYPDSQIQQSKVCVIL